MRNAVVDQSTLICVQNFKLRLRSQPLEWRFYVKHIRIRIHVALNTPRLIYETCTYTLNNLCRDSDTRQHTRCVYIRRSAPRMRFMNSATSELNFLPSKQCRQNDYDSEHTHPFSTLFITSRMTRRIQSAIIWMEIEWPFDF